MAKSSTNRALILKLKKVQEENHYSINNIVDMVEQNGDNISRASVQRVFADGSENTPFSFETTIRPIANALLDIDNIEEDDDTQTQSMKALLQYKDEYIEELKAEIEKVKAEKDREVLKLHESMDVERTQWGKSIEFLKEQVSYKDSRIDTLLKAVIAKDSKLDEKEAKLDQLSELINSCPCRKQHEKGVENA